MAQELGELVIHIVCEGNIFGGYASISWQSPTGGRHTAQRSPSSSTVPEAPGSFLFLLHTGRHRALSKWRATAKVQQW